CRIARGFAAVLDCCGQVDRGPAERVIFEEQAGAKRRCRRARIGVGRHLGGIEIEADDPTANAGALPLAIFMAGGNEGELAPQRSQGRRRQVIDERLTLVANAFFVDEQQMAWRAETEFDLVVGHGLDDLGLMPSHALARRLTALAGAISSAWLFTRPILGSGSGRAGPLVGCRPFSKRRSLRRSLTPAPGRESSKARA